MRTIFDKSNKVECGVLQRNAIEAALTAYTNPDYDKVLFLMKKFSNGVAEQLKHYVYRLIDPRNGQTFYIGRGQRDRIFAHIDEEFREDDQEDELTAKIEIIRGIRRAGLEPTHVIHRHGLDEDTAKEVEAALIDYTPGLTNIASSYGSKRGPANAVELERHYARSTMVPDANHKLLYIKTGEDTIKAKGSLYEAVRQSWKLRPESASQADYVIAVVEQVCKGVFKPVRWTPSSDRDDRWIFEGHEIFGEVAAKYLDKLIPEDKRKLGQANPIRYGFRPVRTRRKKKQ